MKVQQRDPATLRAYPGNPRNNDDAVAAVAASIAEFGFRQPLVIDESGEVVVGHTRLAAALELELAKVPVHVVSDLSDAQRKAYRLADNRLNEIATWDRDLLTVEIADLVDAEFDVSLLGFDADEYGALDDDEPEPGEPDPLEEPEAHVIPTCALGDIWQLGDHVLVIGDALDADVRAMGIDGRKVGAVITDPPYAIYGSSSGLSEDITDDGIVRPFFENVLHACRAELAEFGHAYVFCDWRSWSAWWQAAKVANMSIKNMIVWDKGSAGLGAHYRNTHELCLFASKLTSSKVMRGSGETGQRLISDPNIVREPKVQGDEREHNAQKPVAIYEQYMSNSTNDGDLVLDLFAGSGTIFIAAQRAGRVAVSFDNAPKWGDVAIARWQRETGLEARLRNHEHNGPELFDAVRAARALTRSVN